MSAAPAQIPPHDLDAEAAVIAHVLLHGTAQVALGVADLVSPEEMYSERHRRILEAAYGAARDGSTVDVVTIGAKLRDAGRLEQVGGMAYMTEILDAAPMVTDESVKSYAGIVRSKAQLRKLLATMQKACAEIYLGVSDPEALLSDLERSTAEAMAQHAQKQKGLTHIKDVAIRYAQKLKRQAQGEQAGIPTGLASFDKLTGGVHPGDLTIVAARPGMGKTSLVMNLVDNICAGTTRDGKPLAGLVFSLEMRDEELVGRMIASRSGVDVSSMRNGRVGNRMGQVIQAAGKLSELPIYIDDVARPTVETIRTKARTKADELRRKGHELGLVVIDYLQIMNLNQRKGETVANAIGHITATLKGLAKELSCPVVALSQLNRDLEKRQDKRPQISDLRDSGAIEQDADNIVFVYRDSYYTDKLASGVAELIIAKQRNGPTGTAEVWWDGPTTTFKSTEGDEFGDAQELWG